MNAIIPLPTPTASDLEALQSYDASVRLRGLVERAIVRHLVQAIIAAGHLISVEDGEDVPVRKSNDVEAIVDAVFAVEEASLHLHRDGKSTTFAWVLIVLGNGPDCLPDHTTNIADLLKPTNEYAEALSAWF